MFYIVETQYQLENLKIFLEKPCFLEVIPFSDDIHPLLNKICAFYYRPLASKTGFILPIDHLETIKLGLSETMAFIEAITAQIWTIDSKVTSYYHLENSPLNGLKIAYSLSGRTDFPEIAQSETFAHRFFRKKLKNRPDLNRFIPISKHYEKYEKFFSKIAFQEIPDGYNFYNATVTKNFYNIEKSGIGINPEIFDEKYPRFKKELSMRDGKIYSQYNFFNATARPTCKFNGINFLGFNKNDNTRRMIIPKNDVLIEFDFKSYQVKLLADLIGYEYSGNIHMDLAQKYYPNSPINDNLYKQAKLLTFRYIYGRSKNFPLIPFFEKIYQYRDSLWEEIIKKQYIVSPISNRKIFGISEITQVLPYLMQCIETERNSLIITHILEYLQDFGTKLILYTYDAFLFDFSLEDGKDLLLGLRRILNTNNYETSIKYGDNYQELEDFNLS